MPFTLKTPVVVDGVEYPYAGVSLVTSPGFGESNVNARVVLNLDPYRIDEDGKVRRPMKSVQFVDADGNIVNSDAPDLSHSVSRVFSNAYAAAASDPALASALTAISAAIQQFISAGD